MSIPDINQRELLELLTLHLLIDVRGSGPGKIRREVNKFCDFLRRKCQKENKKHCNGRRDVSGPCGSCKAMLAYIVGNMHRKKHSSKFPFSNTTIVQFILIN